MPLTIPTPTKVGTAAAPWSFQLATHAGINLGDITQARDRKLTFVLNRPTTYEFTADLQSPVADKLLAYHASEPGRPGLLVKAYKFGFLQAVVETTTLELTGDKESHSIRVVCVDSASARLATRLIGQTATGVQFLSQERGSTIAQLLAEQNDAFDTGVRMGTVQLSSTVSAGPFYYKPFLETVQELGASINGYDHWITPADPSEDPNGACGYLNIAPLRGAMRENAIFEYGTGRSNMADYKVQFDGSNRATRVLSVPASWPNSNGLAVMGSSIDTSDVESIIGARETVIDTDLVDTGMRQTLIDEHATVRRYPRQVFSFSPHVNDATGRVPDVLIDYDLGDRVTGRIDDSGIVLLDGIVRVYKAEISLDNTGVEEVVLTTAAEE